MSHRPVGGFNYRPSLSSDGKKIALESDRLGYSDIWYCDNDGSNCAQVDFVARSGRDCARVAGWALRLRLSFGARNTEEIYVVKIPRWPASSGAHFPWSG